jgi:V/A-type H+-transporting ATPase subunit F
MYKIAVMGDRDSIYGFASVGLDIYPIEDPAHAMRKVKALSESDYGVIYMTEALYSALQSELQPYFARVLPAIIPIPGVAGNTGIGLAQVRKSVEKAVGSDIVFKND